MSKKVYFYYGPMNSSKTAQLIMSAYNYREQGKNVLILKPRIDVRDGVDPLITCRPGLSAGCTLFDPRDNLFTLAAAMSGAKEYHCDNFIRSTMRAMHDGTSDDAHGRMVNFGKSFDKHVDCILVDEAQFLTLDQAKQLTDIADYLDIPVLVFGLRNDFQSNAFPASNYLMANAEALRETKGVCFCGSKATHVLRVDEEGKVVKEGEQICVGGNDRYHSVCRFHWKAGVYNQSK